MRTKRIRTAMTLVAAVAAISMATPAPAHANCHGKFTELCQEIENQWCYLTRRCL